MIGNRASRDLHVTATSTEPVRPEKPSGVSQPPVMTRGTPRGEPSRDRLPERPAPQDQPSIPWRQITRMRDHLAHRYFDTTHAILQATVDEDLPDLERAVRTLDRSLKEEDPGTEPGPA